MAAALAVPGLAVAQAGASVWGGVYTPAQAARGQALYSAQCASCHGESLVGADVVPPLSGGTFLGNWDGQTVAALAARIRTTMPLDKPGTLGLAATADVTAFLLSKNDFPAGSVELPADGASQRLLQISAERP